MPNEYDSRELVEALEALDRPSLFLLDRFFPDMVLFETDRVEFDLLDRQDTLAPFVSPRVEGKVMKGRGVSTDSFVPAYVKPKHEVDISRPFKRRAGEAYGGAMSPAERRDAAVAELLVDQRSMILRRKEWMAAQVLTTGAVIVSGEGYPEAEVDFGRDASLSVTLSGSDRWGESGVDPVEDFEDWFGLVAAASGATVDTVVMDPKAWKLARKSEILREALKLGRTGEAQFELGPVSVGGQGTRARKVGDADGVSYWIYQEPFTADDGTPGQMMPDFGVVFGSAAQGAGYQAHGAIRDPNSGYAVEEIWPSNFTTRDPAAEFVMSQSAPLVVPGRVNAFGFAKVR